MNRIIGILAYWIPTYIVIVVLGLLVAEILNLRLDDWGDVFLAVHVANIFVAIILIVLFLFHLRHNILLSSSERFWWAVGLLFVGAVAIPKYYHDHYGPESHQAS